MSVSKPIISTAIGGVLTVVVPWISMFFVRSGDIDPSTAISLGTFIGLVVGALLQWWVTRKMPHATKGEI